MTDIEKLQEIIDEIDVLIEKKVQKSSTEFQLWHYKVKHFLFTKYGEKSFEYKEFLKKEFMPSILNYDAPDSEFVKKCRDDLTVVKGAFCDYLRDLQECQNDSSSTCIDKSECISRIFTHFRKIAIELSHRHDGREPLRIKDEYDVQDLLRALLSLYFDDVRPEEWTPSYAGSSLRIDFLIPEIEAVIEVKKTRPTMTDKTLSEELIVDIEKYQAHPTCKKIYCFVYDPDNMLRYPAAIKNDLEQKHEGLVRVFIES